MAITSKLTSRYSWAAERELIKMAKTMDMEAIVKKTGRSPEFIMKVAARLGIKLKGRKGHPG